MEYLSRQKLMPGVYLLEMVECEESDGHPHLMRVWAVNEVRENPYEYTPAQAGQNGAKRIEQ